MESQTKIREYQSFLSKKFNSNEFSDALLHNKSNVLEQTFLALPILEAQVLRTKLNSFIEDFAKTANDSYDFVLLNGMQQSVNSLKNVYKVIDNYQILLTTLLRDIDKKRPTFYDVFFPHKVEEVRTLILQLYPQTMEVEHYKEIFDLCGYAPFENNDNITQLTMKRLQTFLSYKVVTKEVEVFETYTLAELSGLLREERVRHIIQSFWDQGRLDNLEFIAIENGGKLVMDGNKIKVFEVGTKETTEEGKEVSALIFATPSFYSYQPDRLLNQQKSGYFFLNREPRLATCLVEFPVTLLRQDFLKPPAGTDETRFKVKIQVPINLFKFYVQKL